MNNILKLLIGSIIAVVVIITAIMTALTALKDEAVKNQLTISKLNARSFSKELNQDIINIEQVIQNLVPLFGLKKDFIGLNNHLFKVIKNYPQVRSINILKNKEIIYSSNKQNIGLLLKELNLFPQSIFDDTILKISTPWSGRDFVDGEEFNRSSKIEQSFIPILKKINLNNISYEVIINLNSDYFINRILTNMNKYDDLIFELIRLDGTLLLSTNSNKNLGEKILNFDFLEKAIEKNQYTGIEVSNDSKYISTYILTDNYPISLVVKLDYEKSLLSWDEKQYNFFLITTLIIIFTGIISLLFFYLYNKKIEEQILLKNTQIQDQEKFRSLFQDSHFLAAVVNNDGDILDMNNKALEFLDSSYSSLKNTKFWQLDCWRDEEKIKLENRIKRYRQYKFEDELVIYDKYKNERILDFSFTPLSLENKNISVAIGLDITQKKEREQKLLLAYSIFSNTKDGIMITDKNTNLINVNSAFENITGYKEKEVLHKKANILKSGKHTNKFYENMWYSLSQNRYWQGEITNTKKDGKYFTEYLTISVITNEKDEIVNFIGIFSDITEQKRKEEILREKDALIYQQSKLAAMGEMIANIAHQWRQPLSVISVASTGILFQKELGVSNEDDEKEALEKINQSTQYLSKTIDDFRNFLRNDKELKLFNISESINESIVLSSVNSSKEKDIIVELSLDSEIECYGIKNEFTQVMINIINNAKDILKDSDELKLLLIDSYIENEYIVVTITDSGGGINENIIDRVFEPYFTTKHQSQGTGIGLYMSEEIIKNHMQGTLSVYNKEYTYNDSMYKGACFTIKIPLK